MAQLAFWMPTLRPRSGPCHAVWAVALLMLAGLPAQAAMGRTLEPGRVQPGADASQPPRSRILTGLATEGTLVEAYGPAGHYRRIVAEALNERGRTISTFWFGHGRLLRAHVVEIGYQGYPDVVLAQVPPHRHLVIDRTDTVLDDTTYDFTGDAFTCAGTRCTRARDVRVAAAGYVRLMDTAPTHGPRDEGAWACVHGGDGNCVSFRQEAGQ